VRPLRNDMRLFGIKTRWNSHGKFSLRFLDLSPLPWGGGWFCPLSPGERVRVRGTNGLIGRLLFIVPPHPAFGHLLPRGEGTFLRCLVRQAALRQKLRDRARRRIGHWHIAAIDIE
jgi:hypothetical protein